MIDEVTTAVATGAAGNIVAYMLNGRVDALRAQVGRIFRHGSDKEKSVALSALEDDVVALNQHRVSEADLIARWTSFLKAYLSAHPDARVIVEDFATSAVSKTFNIGSQHNHGSGIFIGGDNYGSIDLGGGK